MNQILRHRKNSQSGQTLIMGVIGLIIVVIAILILFDVHTMIRGKVKAQVAVDSAAIVGANWQMHSLNLIGELNLVKACTVLLSDPVFQIGAGEDFGKASELDGYQGANGKFSEEKFLEDLQRIEEELARVKEVADMLSQMQTRISFVGPMIGYGAAQQAAKNNGLNYNEEAGEFHKRMLELVRDEAIYGATGVPQEINGYYWRGEPPDHEPNPYADMLENILEIEQGGDDGSIAKGIAVGTKIDGLGTPHVKGDSEFAAYLSMQQMYEWIHAKYWCGLKEVIRLDFGQQKWWGNLYLDNIEFIGESEILPLHIEFTTALYPYNQAETAGILRKIAEKRGLQLLGDKYDKTNPYTYQKDENGNVISYTKDSNGLPKRNQGDLYFNFLPEISWALFDSNWTQYNSDVEKDWTGNYLRGDFKEGMNYYSGALAYFAADQDTTTITGAPSRFHSNSGSAGMTSVGQGLRAGSSKDNAFNRYADKASTAQYQMNSTHSIRADATAKPLGTISTDSGTLPPFAAGRMILPVFTKSTLIPVALEPVYGLSSIDYGWFLFVTEYLPMLGTVGSLEEMPGKFEAKKWNKYFQYYHSALLKLNDPEFRKEGTTWLETPIDPVYDGYGNIISYQKTNEDNCNLWPGGGSGGKRYGPGKLH